jgi:hypothetical protein
MAREKPTLKAHLDPEQGPKRILALDGGGVKGIFTLGVLEKLEAELRRRANDETLVLSDYYDLIGGTSTGAIIASGLALGKTVAELQALYLKLGPDVFGKTVGDGGVFRSKFDAKKLRKALDGVLGKRTLGSRDLRTGFALCAKRIDTGSPWVLTNHPASVYYDIRDPDKDTYIPNKKYLLADIVQASAAAPTFFDEVRIPIHYADDDGGTGTGSKEVGYFVDGAVGANNNPSMQLLMLALVNEYGFKWKSGARNLMITSVGTGMRRPRIEGKEFSGKAPGFRGIHALKAMIYDTQLQGVMLMQSLSDSQYPWVVNTEIGGMRDSQLGADLLIDFQRLDARLEKPKGGRSKREEMFFAEDLLGRTFAERELSEMDELANGGPANMDLLLKLGRAVGARIVSSAYPNPVFDLKPWAQEWVEAQ